MLYELSFLRDTLDRFLVMTVNEIRMIVLLPDGVREGLMDTTKSSKENISPESLLAS